MASNDLNFTRSTYDTLNYSMFDFDTTSLYDSSFDAGITWGTLGLILFGCLSFTAIIMMIIDRIKRRVKKQESASWDTLSNINELRQNFRSIESIQIYIHSQHWSNEMRISIILLVLAIAVNTYTNFKVFWHNYKLVVLANSKLGDDLSDFVDGYAMHTGMLAAVEFGLTFALILCTIFWLLFGYYKYSVEAFTAFLPTISAMVLFSYINTDVIKKYIKEILDDSETKREKIMMAIFVVPLVTAILVLFGVWVFYVKIKQISYVYAKDFGELGFADFIAVFGIARQFATLVSINKNDSCWNYPFITLHPEREMELKKNDKKWKSEYKMDKLICKEMVKNRGFFGFCWLCYIFNDVTNVKRLYLEAYKADDDQQNYVMMNDDDL